MISFNRASELSSGELPLKKACEPACQLLSQLWGDIVPFRRLVEDGRYTDNDGRLLETIRSQRPVFREMRESPDYRDFADLERTTTKLSALHYRGETDYRDEPALVARLAGDLRFCRDLFYRESAAYAVLNEVFEGVLALTPYKLNQSSRPSGYSVNQIRNEIIFENMRPFRSDFLTRMGKDWPLNTHREDRHFELDGFFDQVMGINYDREFHPDYERGMISYVSTSAAQFAATILTLPLTNEDVFVDLGSGMGRLPILASLLTGARAVGIEYQRCFSEAAQEYAEDLHLNKVAFVNDDFRNVDLGESTVLFAFDPCHGSMRKTLIEQLRKLARHQPVTVLALGQIGEILGNQSWMYSNPLNHPDEIQILRSR